jgi:hypothetical protein
MSVTAKCLAEGQFAGIAAGIIYSTPASTRTIIDKFTACNSSGSTATLSVYIVPSGQTAGISNTVISNFSLASGQTYVSSEMMNQILASGDTIQVVSGSVSAISVRASGRECS